MAACANRASASPLCSQRTRVIAIQGQPPQEADDQVVRHVVAQQQQLLLDGGDVNAIDQAGPVHAGPPAPHHSGAL
jgi:hypothetical protein